MHKNCKYWYRGLLYTFTEILQLLTFYAMKIFLSFFHSLQSGEIFIFESLDSGLDTAPPQLCTFTNNKGIFLHNHRNHGHLTSMQYNYLIYRMYSFLSTVLNIPFITFLVCLSVCYPRTNAG